MKSLAGLTPTAANPLAASDTGSGRSLLRPEPALGATAFHRGRVRLGLQCRSGHVWTALFDYDAFSGSLHPVTPAHLYCPTCEQGDLEMLAQGKEQKPEDQAIRVRVK